MKSKRIRLHSKLKKIKCSEIYLYLCLVLIIYTSGSIYNSVYNGYNQTIKLICAGILLAGMPCLKKTDHKKCLFFNCLFVLLYLWTLVAGGLISNVMKMHLRLFAIFVFFLYANRKRIDLLKKMYNTILVFAIFFLIMWLLFDIGPFISMGRVETYRTYNEAFDRVSYTSYTNYFNIYYRWKSSRHILGLYFNACNGPFWEPGVYQIWLNFGLWYTLFRGKHDLLRALVFVVGIISTTSTMGAIIMFMIILLWAQDLRKGVLWKVISLLPAVGVGMIAIGNIIIERANTRAESLYGRASEIGFQIRGILSYPIFGNGSGILATTNGFFLYAYEFGILGSSLMFFFAYGIFKNKDKLYEKLAIFIWLVLSLSNEPISYFNLTILMILCLYKEYDQTRFIKNKARWEMAQYEKCK